MLNITTAELSAMQAEMNTILTDTCSITHVISSPNMAGGMTVSTSSTTGIQCRITKFTNRGEAISAGKVTSKNTYLIILPTSIQISERDTILCNSRTYEIHNISHNTFDIATYLECSLKS